MVLENDDLILCVLVHLDAHDLARIAQCTKLLRTHALDNNLWERLVARRWPAASGLENVFFRYVYRSFHERHASSVPTLRSSAGHLPLLLEDAQFIVELRHGDVRHCHFAKCVDCALAPLQGPNGWVRCGHEVAAQTVPHVSIEEDEEGVSFVLRLGRLAKPEVEIDSTWNLSLSLYHSRTKRVGFLCDQSRLLSFDAWPIEGDWDDWHEDGSLRFGGYHSRNDSSMTPWEEIEERIAPKGYPPAHWLAGMAGLPVLEGEAKREHLHHLFWSPRLDVEQGTLRIYVRYVTMDIPRGVRGRLPTFGRFGTIHERGDLIHILTQGASWR